ncbi:MULTISPECIES: hypothetical protein [Brevibacterium]|nr:hypothetical protein [Brevibacterium sandarakinum]
MYSIMTTARLLRSGFTKRELARAEKCCVQRIARGRYAVERTCRAPEHATIWAAVSEGSAEQFETFNDRRDSEQNLKALIRARAEKVNEEYSSDPAGAVRETFSHLSAALIHGLPLAGIPDPRVEILRPGAARKHRHLRVRNAALPSAHVTAVGIYRVTTVERTLVDVALTYDLATAVTMIDDVLHNCVTDVDSIERIFAECGQARAQLRARSAFDLADDRRESPAETIAAVRLFESGIGGFEPQVEFKDDFGRVWARVDFCHRGSKVIIEVDGLGKYSMGTRTPRQALEAEKNRDARLMAQGYRVIHLTWRQLFSVGPFEDIKRVVAERAIAR